MKPRAWEGRTGKSLIERQQETVLTVANMSYSYQEVVEDLKCGHMRAVHNLDWALKRFKANTIRQLARKLVLDDLAMIPGIGETAIHVWLCVLDQAGIDALHWLDRTDSTAQIASLCARAKKRKKGKKHDNVVHWPASHAG